MVKISYFIYRIWYDFCHIASHNSQPFLSRGLKSGHFEHNILNNMKLVNILIVVQTKNDVKYLVFTLNGIKICAFKNVKYHQLAQQTLGVH